MGPPVDIRHIFHALPTILYLPKPIESVQLFTVPHYGPNVGITSTLDMGPPVHIRHIFHVVSTILLPTKVIQSVHLSHILHYGPTCI